MIEEKANQTPPESTTNGTPAANNQPKYSGYDWQDNETWSKVKAGIVRQTETGESPNMGAAFESYYDDAPEKPDGYKFSPIWGQKIDADQLNEVRGIFHEARLPTGIAKYVYEAWGNAGGKAPSAEQLSTSAAKTEAQLRKAWGDDYDAQMALANSVLNELSPDTRQRATQFLTATGLGNDVFLIRKLATLGAYRKSKRG